MKVSVSDETGKVIKIGPLKLNALGTFINDAGKFEDFVDVCNYNFKFEGVSTKSETFVFSIGDGHRGDVVLTKSQLIESQNSDGAWEVEFQLGELETSDLSPSPSPTSEQKPKSDPFAEAVKEAKRYISGPEWGDFGFSRVELIDQIAYNFTDCVSLIKGECGTDYIIKAVDSLSIDWCTEAAESASWNLGPRDEKIRELELAGYTTTQATCAVDRLGIQ